MKRVMCVWLPNWPIQRRNVAQPAVKQTAIVLHEASRPGRDVVACSRRAAEIGVRPGMPLAEALSRLGAHPAQIEPYDAAADCAALVRLAEWCHRFSPRVGLAEEAEQPYCDSLLFDVTGCERLYHGEQALADGVLRQLRDRGLTVRLAIADTIGAAWGLARHLDEDRPSLVAPKAGEVAADQGDQGLAAALGRLPVAALRLSTGVRQRLRQLGLETIAQLEQLPRGSLPARFGDEPLRRLDQLFGRTVELFQPLRPLEPLRADWTFERAMDRSEVLLAVIDTLLERVVRQLEARQHGADALRCWLYVERREPVLIEVALYRTNAHAGRLSELIRMQLESLRLAQPVTAIRVDVPAASPLEAAQHELFPSGAPSGPTPLAVLVERLANRLGRQSVVQAEISPDPQPECAVRYEPLVGPQARPRSLAHASRCDAAGQGASPREEQASAVLDWEDDEAPIMGRWRPLRMAPQPLAVEVIAAPDGRPAWCVCRGSEHRLLRTWGPERIETGWWRESTVRRDYYRVETASGCRFWLFHRLNDGRWFLHGWFE